MQLRCTGPQSRGVIMKSDWNRARKRNWFSVLQEVRAWHSQQQFRGTYPLKYEPSSKLRGPRNKSKMFITNNFEMVFSAHHKRTRGQNKNTCLNSALLICGARLQATCTTKWQEWCYSALQTLVIVQQVYKDHLLATNNEPHITINYLLIIWRKALKSRELAQHRPLLQSTCHIVWHVIVEPWQLSVTL